jgi:hypothetical protein
LGGGCVVITTGEEEVLRLFESLGGASVARDFDDGRALEHRTLLRGRGAGKGDCEHDGGGSQPPDSEPNA